MSTSSVFVTLTYADKFLPLKINYETGEEYNSFDKKEVQKFMKRLRKMEQPNKIRFYLVSEYGEDTLRPHYHALIFNISGSMDEIMLKVLKTWQKGLIHVGAVTNKSIKYVTKYVINKVNYPDGWEKPFSLMSKSIGLSYVDKYSKWHKADLTRNYTVHEGGAKNRFPRYYKEKILSKFERQKMAALSLKNDNTEINFKDQFDQFEEIKRKLVKNSKSKKV